MEGAGKEWRVQVRSGGRGTHEKGIVQKFNRLNEWWRGNSANSLLTEVWFQGGQGVDPDLETESGC